MGQLLGRDAEAGVGDDDRGASVLGGYIEPDAPARRREFQGVVEHDEQQLAHQGRVAADPRLVERAHLHEHPPLIGAGARRIDGAGDGVVQVQRLPHDRPLTGTGTRSCPAATSARVRSSVIGVRNSCAASAMKPRICSIERRTGAVDLRTSREPPPATSSIAASAAAAKASISDAYSSSSSSRSAATAATYGVPVVPVKRSTYT